MVKASITINDTLVQIDKHPYGFKNMFVETYKYTKDYLSELGIYDMQLNPINDGSTKLPAFKIEYCKEQSILLRFYNTNKCTMSINNITIKNDLVELPLKQELTIKVLSKPNKKHYYEIKLIDIRQGDWFVNLVNNAT